MFHWASGSQSICHDFYANYISLQFEFEIVLTNKRFWQEIRKLGNRCSSTSPSCFRVICETGPFSPLTASISRRAYLSWVKMQSVIPALGSDNSLFSLYFHPQGQSRLLVITKFYIATLSPSYFSVFLTLEKPVALSLSPTFPIIINNIMVIMTPNIKHRDHPMHVSFTSTVRRKSAETSYTVMVQAIK